GLDLHNDSIIEIAAVRFKEGEILDTFDTLIDPGVPIPSRITSLTGITDEAVTGSPRMYNILDSLREFIGDLPILGHSISTDVGFLRAAPYFLAMDNPLIDTYELAAFLLPVAPRYSLGSLVEYLGLDDLNAHRALDDILATCQVYWTLWQRILDMPLDLLKEIVAAAERLDWDAKLPLIDALQLRSKTALSEAKSDRPIIPFKPSLRNEWPTLRENQDLAMLEVDAMAGLIEPGGRVAESIAGYESRESQIRMVRAVSDALNSGLHIMIEAPTGTGKSLAYLIPAMHWATQNNSRVVISTATIALQDQIIKKDLPALKKALGHEFTAAVAKGRSNYLCPRRLDALRRRRPTSTDELRVLAKVLVWLQHSDTGDKGEISLRGFGEDMAWLRMSAQDEGCTLSRCEAQMEGACPFYKARRRAEGAPVLITNHALLLSDVYLGNRVLPDYRYLIIDEAHQLEEATTKGLSTKIDRNTLQRRFDDLGDDRKGLFGEVLQVLRGTIPQDRYERLEQYIETVGQALREMGHHLNNFFQALMTFLHSTGELQNSDYASQVRIRPNTREHPQWIRFAEKWDHLQEFFVVVADAIQRFGQALDNLDQYDIPNYDDHLNSLESASRYFQETYELLKSFTVSPNSNNIYWCEVNSTNTHVAINSAPLHVGPLIRDHLWQAKESVVLTSATLTTAGSFNFIRDRLHASEVADLIVPTPFDYKESTLVFIPNDIPEPNQRQLYQAALERSMIELATATNGRMLGLFTSYSQLRQTAHAIAPRLALGGISVFDQASGSSRQLLIDSFKSTEKAVLLGTRSFWEGIDLPGDDLQVLVIARLPFAVPSDPIFAARAETFENSFFEYTVPDAILRFRQGFGRLIRRQTDRGVVVILDKRIVSKRYGRAFIDSLPGCTVKHGSLNQLPELAKKWIDA
ncbi:MAG: DEAD/DEAH box helicase, partial [Chloroflexi bacterium]|nr:DEAD/DEAH box helicase [Chloroflexota bacterium]